MLISELQTKQKFQKIQLELILRIIYISMHYSSVQIDEVMIYATDLFSSS